MSSDTSRLSTARQGHKRLAANFSKIKLLLHGPAMTTKPKITGKILIAPWI